MVKEVQDVLDCRNWDDEFPVCIDATLGTAGHTMAFLRANPALHVVAFDRDAHSQQLARERLREAGLESRVTIVHCDFRFADYVIREIGAQDRNTLLNLDNQVLEVSIFPDLSAKVLFGEELRQRLITGQPWPVRGALLDAGMSLYQVSLAERGLSFNQDGPLDMRYNKDQEISAYELVNQLPEEELSELFFRYTDERWARRIATRIAEHRRSNPVRSTSELAGIITAAIPAPVRRQSRVHPATKSFAALRMAVNDEYWALEEGAWALGQALAIDARLAVLTYSSTEDRTIKRTFRRLADRMPEVSMPRKSPRAKRRLKHDSLLHALTAVRTSLTTNLATDILPTDHSTALTPAVLQEAGWEQNWMMKIITNKPLVPSDEEISNNPLSRSAKLRAIEKIALP